MTDQNANVVISADTSGYSQNVNQATQQTNQLASAVDNLSSHLDGLTKRAGKRLILFGAADLAALTGAVAIAAKLDDQTKSLQASLTGTGKSVDQYVKSIDSMARSLPVARGELAQMVTMLDKMGIQSADAAMKMTTTFQKLGAATSESATGLAQSMVQLNKQMGTLASGSSAMTGFSNSLLQVSKSAGVSAQGILDFSQNLAPIARTAGMTEKQLLGVSAAFTSAGQDGFAAANAFNTMLSDITRSIRDGSPDITKYSNLLGVTVDQFKQMSSSDQMVGLFEAINKQGPNAIRILDQLGIDGIRASKAIQGAVQTGSLRAMVATASSGYNTTGSDLNKSSEAAWSGMNSALQSMQNQFQQIGQAIGSSLVGPATSALGVFNAMLGTVNNIAHPILAMGGVLAGVMGGTALGGGAAMSTLSTFGQVAMAGYVLRSRPVRALLGGFSGGMAGASGNAMGKLGASQEELYTGNQMPRWQQQMYLAGRGFGNALGDPNRGGQNFLGRAATAPLRLLGWGARASSQFYDDSMTNGENRALPFGKASLTADARVSGATADANREIKKMAKGYAKDVAAGRMTEAEAAENIRYQKTLAKAAVTAAGSLDQFSGAAREAAGAMSIAGGKNIRAGLTNIGSVAGRGLKGLGSMFGGPMMAITGAMAGYSMFRGAQDSLSAGTPEASANPISEYNAALGISTDKLMNFGAVVAASSKKFDTVAGALSDVANAAKIAASSGKYTSSVAAGLNGTDSSSGLAFLRSVGGQLNPQNAPDVMADLVRKYGADQAKQIYSQYQADPNYGQKDITALLNSTQAAQDYSAFGLVSNIKSGGVNDQSNTLGRSLSGNINAISSAIGTGNQFRGQQVYGSLAMSSLAGIVSQQAQGKLDNASATHSVNSLEDIFGGKIGFSGLNQGAGLNNSWSGSAAEYVGKDRSKLTPEDVKKWLKDKAIPDNPVLKQWYDNQVALGVDPFMDTSKAYVSNPNSLTPTQKAINGTGLGNFAQKDVGVQYALNEGYGSQRAQFGAVRSLTQQAMAIGGGDQGQTVVAFDKLISAINQSSDRLSQLSTAAYQAYQALVALQRGNYSPGQGATMAINSATSLIQSPTTDTNSQNQQDALSSRAKELAGIRDYYQQYAMAMYQYQKQIGRSSYDFYQVTLPRMELAYHKQSLYAQQDYAKSMKRAAESAAQGIYDPWQRVYSQLVSGAANEVSNLTEQNQMLVQQRANLNKAHKLGLSQQTIDSLDLTNPANAQQLQALVDDISANPGFIKALNKAAAARLAATRALTQNKDNLSFRNAAEDFATNTARSADAYKTSVGQMTDDYHRMMGRAKEDMNDYGKVMSGNFSKISTYVNKMMKDLGLSNTYVSDIAKAIAANPDLLRLLGDPNFGSLDPTGTNTTPATGGATPKAMAQHYGTTPGAAAPIAPVTVSTGRNANRSATQAANLQHYGSTAGPIGTGTNDHPNFGFGTSNTNNIRTSSSTTTNHVVQNYTTVANYNMDRTVVTTPNPDAVLKAIVAKARMAALNGGKYSLAMRG